MTVAVRATQDVGSHTGAPTCLRWRAMLLE
jgi:hypothetical protein